jgi:Sec-independent protein translocase protein TatA
MLDNFGMGEFLVLVFFAILFFGPERLPQIGARVGRWLAQLTQASKQFMNQWTEEAAAIQDAVLEVKGIRDEIRAAQHEISQSLNTAREDITETIDEARGTIREATPKPGAIMERRAPPGLATSEGAAQVQAAATAEAGDEGAAIAKTQEIVNALFQAQEGGDAREDQANGDGAQSEVESEEDAYQKNLRAMKEIMARSTRNPVTQGTFTPAASSEAGDAPEVEDAPEAEGAPEAETVRGDLPAGTAIVKAQVGQTETREERESPFDKTQRILNQLMGIEPKPEAEEEQGPAVGPEPLQELSVVTGIAAVASVEAGTPASGAAEAGASDGGTDAPEEPVAQDAAPAPAEKALVADGVQRVEGLDTGVSSGQFTKLSIEVGQLRGELRKLRQELAALRATQAAQPSDGVGQAKSSSDAMPVEEAA